MAVDTFIPKDIGATQEAAKGIKRDRLQSYRDELEATMKMFKNQGVELNQAADLAQRHVAALLQHNLL